MGFFGDFWGGFFGDFWGDEIQLPGSGHVAPVQPTPDTTHPSGHVTATPAGITHGSGHVATTQPADTTNPGGHTRKT